MSPPAPDPTRRIALLLIAAHVLSMAGFATYPALLAELRDAWSLSNSEAGMIGGLFFAGYVAAVSYATALTDRIDGRRVYLAGGALGFAGCAGFGLLADGFASAVFFQMVHGAGIAATYMPGLRILTDRSAGAAQSRYVAFYTSFFGIGTALSYALAGVLAPMLGWRAAFVLSALGPLAAGLIVWFGVPPTARAPVAARPFSLATLFPLAAWRRVLAIRAAAGYTLGYTVHCIELFGSRAWMVAFLAFSTGLHAGGASFPWHAAAIAACVNLLSVPASILGNEAALRIGRRRWILVAMAASGASGIALGAAAALAWPLVLALLAVYTLLVMAESATLTAGLIASAPADLRGTAMGLYSLSGFAGGMLGPILFGFTLDLAGGTGSPAAWVWAYAAIGAGCLGAPLAVRLAAGRR
ncbi:MAG: nitrate/nitrite transporter [Burkholderiales bacterium]